MTVAKISEDKDWKNTLMIVGVLVFIAFAICVASSANKPNDGTEPVKQYITDSPVGYP
jgi:hypothetical protein